MSAWRHTGLGVVLGLALGCTEAPRTSERRAELRQLGTDRVELLPAAEQLPYCLVFSRSATGVLRQLTMTHENKSVRCQAGEPVGKVSYRIPVEEGEVQLFVFFSDQKLHAGSVSQQLYELPQGQAITPLNLRLPGRVRMETLRFKPERESPVALGAVVGTGGQLELLPDGGTPAAPVVTDSAPH